jgi:glycosyltransferase involved in cell wall biosynthesis
LVEASYAGLPAVAENVGAVSEVVSNGQTGFLVNGFEERKIALEKLINDHELRRKFGEAARKKMELGYNTETFMNSHLEVYRDLLSKKSTR